MSDSPIELKCKAEDCHGNATRKAQQLCEKHYYRMRRNGSLDLKVRAEKGLLDHSGGYKLEHAPSHPLKRGKHNRVYQHRIVYYDAHGDGPFPCHWCSKTVTWDDLHIDHLNDAKDDNRVENLVPSCPLCNQARGAHKMRDGKRLGSTRRYTAHGKTMCISEWAEHLGLSRNSLEYRLAAGWKLEDVFSPRKGKTGPPSRKKAALIK